MDIKGIVDQRMQYERDRKRFNEVIEGDPEQLKIAEERMLESVRKLVELSVPAEDIIVVGRQPHHKVMTHTTPWVCRTESPDQEMSASIRFAHNDRGESPHTRVWQGAVELRVEGEPTSEADRLHSFTLSTFHVYEEPANSERPVTLIVDLNRDSDFGQPGSPSWDQLQEMLDEAYLELSAQQVAV